MTDKTPHPAHALSPQVFLPRLLETLAQPRAIREIAADLDLTPDALAPVIQRLAAQGLVHKLDDGRVQRAQGQTGAGYVGIRGRNTMIIPDDRTLPMMPMAPGSEGAFPGDRVLYSFKLIEHMRYTGGKETGGGNYEAKVLSVIAERPGEVVGIYTTTERGDGMAKLWGMNKPREVFVEAPRTAKLQPGMLVRLSLPRAAGRRGMTGTFISMVSDIEVPSQDTESIAALFDFPVAFNPNVLEVLDRLPSDPEPADIAGRLDLRHELIITIDPADAKDHDDAVSIEKLPGGMWRLGVHIADVGTYVTPQSLLSDEAYDRATSIYLPGKTIPMLPEKLSAGLCSLQEGRPRLAKSCYMTFDKSGVEVRREVLDSIIEVKRFLNYEQAKGILENTWSAGAEIDACVRETRALADVLRHRRMEGGSIVLSIDRPHLILDDKGLVAAVTVDKSDAAHNLIEECMLAANRAVASFMLEHNLPYIARIHPEPDLGAEEEFGEFCRELGMAGPNFAEPRRVQLFLDGLKGRPGEHAIHLAVLKSMKRAVYAPHQGLHYALGFLEYTHFTSPIRRLCDLTVHQVLCAYLQAGGILKHQIRDVPFPWADGSPLPSAKHRMDGSAIEGAKTWRLSMPAIAAHATDREQRSSKAEMETVQLKLIRLMEDRVGEVFIGTVSHIGSHGVMVQLDDIWVEGTLFYAGLSEEWVTPRKFWVEIATRGTTRTIRVGDRLYVQIEDVIVATRTLRLKLATPGQTASHAAKKGVAAPDGPGREGVARRDPKAKDPAAGATRASYRGATGRTKEEHFTRVKKLQSRSSQQSRGGRGGSGGRGPSKGPTKGPSKSKRRKR